MQKKNKNHTCQPPEILAPAGDMDSLLGALKGKADAVYLGVGDLNARQGAKNFTLDELEDAIDLAHLRNVKVFLALNIPIKQNELQTALDVVDEAYSYGIDAIILEDLGLMSLLRKTYPDLPLHASTQMTIHNKKGVDFIEEAGAARVILSRELSSDQVSDIINKSNIDVELFVHGALCYSYSGRCLFSSFLSKRSANRGACIQPCRRKYKVMVDGKEISNRIIGEYPISCAELCTFPEIEKLVHAGVKSLKIEGRMKRPEYVTASSTIYKDAVDRICSTGENFYPEDMEEREAELTKLFYRGFTKGFVLEEDDVTHQKYSSNYGIFLGKVQRISPSKSNTGLDVILHQDITDKDGIAIFTQAKMLGCKINSIKFHGEEVTEASAGERVTLEISTKTAKAVRNHDEVYLSTDTALLERLQKQKLRGVPLDIRVSAKNGKPVVVAVKEERGEITFTDEYVVQDAKSSPTTKEQIIKAITKLGDTPYISNSIKVDADENIFIPMGVLTGARRQATSLLEEKVLENYKHEEKKPLIEDSDASSVSNPDTDASSKEPLLGVEVNGPKFLPSAIDGGADIVYMPIEWFETLVSGGSEISVQELAEKNVEIVFMTPQVSFDNELMETEGLMKRVHGAGFKVTCSDLGAIELAKEMGMDYVVQKDMNIFNAATVSNFFDSGACRVTLSTELNLDEIKDISGSLEGKYPQKQVEIVIHGRELLLVTENDLLKPVADQNMLKRNSDVYLIDKNDDRFPVRRSGTRTLIYHSKVLNMFDHIDEVMTSGADVLRLDLSLNSRREVAEFTKAYKDAISGKPSKMRGNNRETPTTGHYFDGVL
ncbi:DUF3656 domain-containing protein [Methanolobus sp. ZRKC3]|uniref:DUF3656 domain-containing U32 family peptidase n=1 Tax=Methanolobus sp. ZRKC3 TaxID=3125786 RepID=UPI00324FB1F3